MSKYEPLSRLVLSVRINSGSHLEVWDPERAGDRVKIPGPCILAGSVELIKGREWFRIRHMTPYSIPLRPIDLGGLPSRIVRPSTLEQLTLKKFWDDNQIEVTVQKDGSEKDYFDV